MMMTDVLYIYISLYDISTKDELERQIAIHLLPFKELRESKGFNAFSSIGKVVVGGFLNFKGVNLPEANFNLIDFLSLKDSIFIFDDLERCNMDINELLVYINNFVEHDGLKTIIVSNEKEIAKSKIIGNKELKYLVALSKDMIFPEYVRIRKSNPLTTDNQNNSNEGVNIKELSNRVHTLFGEDEMYKQIKEKLIGTTIYYKPNLSIVIDTITNANIATKKIKEVICNNKKFIIEKMELLHHQNIRTLLFSFDKFNTIALSLIKQFNYSNLDKILIDILKYTVVFSIHYKSGSYLPKWENSDEIDKVSFGEGLHAFHNTIQGFKFIDDFVLGANYDEERALEIIKRYISVIESQNQDPNGPLNRLKNDWWLMEDKEAKELLNEVNQTLVSKPQKYDITSYSNILFLNIIFNKLELFTNKIDDIVDRMKTNFMYFELNDTFNRFGWRTRNFIDEEDKKLYSIYMEELNESLKQHISKTDTINLKYILSKSDTWADDISRYIEENRSKIYEQKSFLSKMNFEKLLDRIKNSSISQIDSLRGSVTHDLYNSAKIKEYFDGDKEYIEKLSLELKDYISETRDQRKIWAYYTNFLIKDLENILEQLN